MPAQLRTWSSSGPCRLVEGSQDNGDFIDSEIWFRTEPLDNTFIYRAAQLQLYTDSHDQGWVENEDLGAWSWFELVILPDASSTQPVVRDGKVLAWTSHTNRLGDENNSRHFGTVFDRRQELLDALEPGNVIGVRVCAQFPGWFNQAHNGILCATVLDTDLFSPMNWSISSTGPAEDIPEAILHGIYTITSTTGCHVEVVTEANDPMNLTASRVWFTTPVLEKHLIPRIEDVQLKTHGHDQGACDDPSAGSWSWYDLAILESTKATEPRVKDGRALVWRSHNNEIAHREPTTRTGIRFDRNHELLSLLEEGNVIAVCVCARFAGWTNHGESGQLIVRIANQTLKRDPKTFGIDYAKLAAQQDEGRVALEKYLNALTPDNAPPAYLDIAKANAQPWRADDRLGSDQPRLRLLSLDGGGVRGISSLYILQQLMLDATGSINTPPCEYFDMICGTSTGGLIAIMLGRLRMTVPKCIQAYQKLSKIIFKDGERDIVSYGRTGAWYDEKTFVKALQDFLTSDEFKPRFSADELMADPDSNACKVFVLAARAQNVSNEQAVHLRTYKNQNADNFGRESVVKIWEAARATSAAPSYFLQQKVGGENFVDGGLSANNPILLLINEAESFFGPARPKACVVSLGTGMMPTIAFEDGKILKLADYGPWMKLATGTEQAHLLVKNDSRVKAVYHRFNVGKYDAAKKDWLEPIKLWAWDKMATLVSWTGDYLKQPEVKKDVEVCAQQLSRKAT
ncbi:acyl transferase/acyl hydrolase/lysophospholipase [Mycena latifolia]|nr:acyl transferase/acyl hydrolase/lysophospholipase [Mycena latifolia]